MGDRKKQQKYGWPDKQFQFSNGEIQKERREETEARKSSRKCPRPTNKKQKGKTKIFIKRKFPMPEGHEYTDWKGQLNIL